jgi:D-hydroxyproline dehydrogenase subunit beta
VTGVPPTPTPDFAVVGGGIVGVAAALFLAEGGASVELFERAELGAAASGRNSGAIQHPWDGELLDLHEESLRCYRRHLGLAGEPAGLLVLGEAEAMRSAARDLAGSHPELRPQFVARAADLEPALASDLAACRLATGYPVAPRAATLALARAAREAGAVLREGSEVRDLRELSAGAVLVAAGPWSPALVDPTGAWQPIAPLWGAVAEVHVPAPPGHVLEEAGVEEIAGDAPLFSLVTAEGASTVGSTFQLEEPDPRALAPALLARGARFVPALGEARLLATRACARPSSADGRPLLGPVPGRARVWIAAGHGPWGISTGPGSARAVADALLGRGPEIRHALDAARFAAPGLIAPAPT